MGIHNALYSGIAGLNSSTDGMSVIANNIANAGTKSFKTDRAEFEDILAASVSESARIGRGSRFRGITTMFSQGSLTGTSGLTDLGIQGNGFFVVKNTGGHTKDTGTSSFNYTRQGAFHFDKDGSIVDYNGNRVQGYMADKDGKLKSRLGDMQIITGGVPPAPTTRLTLSANLDVREASLSESFDPKRPEETSNYSTTVSIFDSLGNAHKCTLYFRRTDDKNQNSWDWHALVDGNEISDNKGVDEKGRPIAAEIAKGKIDFDVDGRPIMKYVTRKGKPSFIDTIGKTDAVDVKFTNGAQAQKIQFNLGPQEDEYGEMGSSMCTSMANNSVTLYHSQNGYESGNIKTMRIEQDGSIRGVYTNGLERRLGSFALATFANQDGLIKIGQNSYGISPRAGAPLIGTAGSGTRGTIFSSTLEESNVDIAQQFVDMITTQRGFQANSKSITTTDSMMEEILNLKR